jgi:hypothetical protein
MAIPFINGSVPNEVTSCTGRLPVGKIKQKPRYLIDWLKELIK